MPSTSKKQHRFMEAVANNPKFAKKAGVPQSVGKEFEKADKGMKFRQGGVKRMASGGKTPDQIAQTRLANMREEEAEVAEGRRKQQAEERLASYRRGIGMDDLRAAQKQGKTYDKWFEDNRKEDLKKGRMSKEAYDAGKGIEMLTPSQQREAMVSGYKKGGRVKRYVEGGTLEMMTGEKQNGPEYSAEDIKEGLKKLGRFFSFSRPESEPSAPIETRRGSPKPSKPANVLDEDPLGSAKLVEDAKQRMAEAVLKPAVGMASPLSRAQSRADYEGDAKPSSDVFKPSKADAPAAAPKVERVASPAPRVTSPAARVASPAARVASPEVVRKSETVVLPKTRDQKIAENKKVIEEKILASKPTALTAQMRNAPTGEQLYAGQQSLSDFLMTPFKSLRESNEARRKEEEKRRKDIRDRAIARQEESHMAKGGKVAKKTQAFAKGGFVKKSIDGCAQRGKTRGQMK